MFYIYLTPAAGCHDYFGDGSASASSARFSIHLMLAAGCQDYFGGVSGSASASAILLFSQYIEDELLLGPVVGDELTGDELS